MTIPLTPVPTLYALGEARLVDGPVVPRRKELALLAYVACQAPKAVRREELAALFWGEREGSKARQSLRQALLELRRAIGPSLEVGPDRVSLPAGAITLDVALFEEDLTHGRLEQGVARWEGDFLEGFDDLGTEPFRIWLEAERQRLRRRATRALADLTSVAEGRNDRASTLRWATRRAELFPLDEDAHQRLVQVLRAAGRTSEADARHAAFIARFKGELEAEPSPILSRLSRQLSAEADRATAAVPSVALFTPDLIGREEVFGELTAAWKEAKDGGCAMVLVEGEQGIGKTRLCEEFLAELAARREPCVVLRAKAREDLAAAPLAMARELLDGLRAAPGLLGADASALAELRQVVSWVDDVFPSLPRAPTTPSALAAALGQIVAAVGEELPVLVFLDDAPDADAATLDLLVDLVKHAPSHVLLLLTAASGTPAFASLSRTASTLRSVRRLKLQPLTDRHVDAMLASMLVMPEKDRWALAARLHHETGGNPYYVTELTSALVDDGWLAPNERGEWRASATTDISELPVPPGVREALLVRLTRVDPDSRKLLDAASVFRTPVDADLLADLTGMSPGVLAAGLDELITRRMLRHAPTHPGAFEFAHDLLRRTVVGALDDPTLNHLHRRAADALGRRAATDPNAGLAAEYHRRLTWQPVRSAWSSRRRWLVAAVGVVAAIVALIPALRPRRTPDAVGLLVLPFRATVAEAASWSEALPDLLATTIEGTPGLRVVDPWSGWRDLRERPSDRARNPEVQEAEALARKTGANWYVIGSLMAERGRLNVAARLYRVGSADPQLSLTREASTDSVLSLSQELAVALIAQMASVTRNAVGPVEANATTSATALKAYLSAKEAMRRGMFDSADVAIDRAVALDSNFGLALTEAGMVKTMSASIRGQGFFLNDVARRAVERTRALGEPHRLRAEGLLASVSTQGQRAENAQLRLIQIDSSNLAAWSSLAYVRWAYGWQYGATLRDAIEASERAVRLDSTYVSALYTRAWLAVAAAEPRDLRQQRQRLARTDTTVLAVQAVMMAIDATLATDAELPSIIDRATSAPPAAAISVVRTLTRTRPVFAETLLVRLRHRWQGDPIAMAPNSGLVRLMLTEGRGSVADSIRRVVADQLGARNDLSLERLMLAARIAGSAAEGDARDARRVLEAFMPIDSALALQGRRDVYWYGWQLAAYHATHGDTSLALRWATILGRLNRGRASFDFPAALESDVRARLAVRRNDRSEALVQAKRAYDLWPVHTENISEATPEPAMRFHLASLYRASGQRDSAEAIFRSLVPPTAWFSFYSGLSALELAELLEERRSVEAATYYRFVLQYWERGGEEVRTLRERASAGVKRVEQGGE